MFNAITKQAVLDAMANPRDIDAPLVDAYLARRALDYLVGFTLSPVLWRKLPGARSAGRVQSVALRLVCDREAEIERFCARTTGRSPHPSDAAAGDLRGPAHRIRRQEPAAARHRQTRNRPPTSAPRWRAPRFRVLSVEAKPARRNPAPPFTTSTLQQEASRKLGFSAVRTMQIAQRLYEGVDIGGETVGLITYMRTDGVQIAPEAIAGGAQRDRGWFRRPLRPRQAAPLFDQGQERTGGA